VNFTETKLAMSMITKAGMPPNKVVVGMASYGRSFKMTKAGCSGPMCTYTGPESGALKGRCTGTAGYLALAEINEIIDTNPDHQRTFDDLSYSDILVYNGTEYVAYMSVDRKAEVELIILALQWGGVTDWAIDLVDMYTQPSEEVITMEFCFDKFNTLDDLAKAGDSVPSFCIDIYALQIMNNDFKTAMSKYNNLLHSGYDGKFNTYAAYVNDTMYTEIDEYMTTHGSNRFHCISATGGTNHTVTCPTSIPSDPFSAPDEIYWILDDEKGFFQDMMDSYGIDQTWIKFGDLYVWVDPGCHPQTAEDLKACQRYWHGYPLRDVEHMQIPNPKDTISGAMKNLTDFGNQLDESAADAGGFMYTQDVGDAVDAAQLPLFLTESAVQQMQKIIDAADSITAAEKKSFIVNFVGSLLMLVPAVGETIWALGLGILGRVVLLAGEVGNAAFGVYGVVEDPTSAIFSIFGAIIGVRGEIGFERAAGSRRSMSEKESTVLGKFVQDRQIQIDAVQKRSCKA
jgi:hypothetical protein